MPVDDVTMVRTETRAIARCMALIVAMELGTGCGVEHDEVAEPTHQSRLSMVLHDAPADAVDSLLIEMTKVRLRSGSTGEWLELPATPGVFDLLELQGGRNVDVLVNAMVPTDDYDELRLLLANEPLALLDGQAETVAAPSATSSGLKIKGSFSVEPGGCVSLEVDFDARRSLEAHADGFRLSPVLNVVGSNDACDAEGEPDEPSDACTWGDPTCDVCVTDVLASFSRERTHGYPLRLGRGDIGYRLSESNHYQGCTRIKDLLICSRSGAGVSVEVFQMGSRTDLDAPFYSNIMGEASVALTPPPDEDGLGCVIAYEAEDPDAASGHSGGVDKEGCFVAVPMEGGGGDAKVALYDFCGATVQSLTPHEKEGHSLRTCELDSVTRVATMDGSEVEALVGPLEARTDEAGTVSLARLQDGNYLMIVGREDADVLDFFRSPSLQSPFTFDARWEAVNSDGIQVGTELPDGDRRWMQYQSLTAVMQCDGNLFLIGMHHDALWNNYLGEDWADLYRVDLDGVGAPAITKVAKKHFWCDWEDGMRQCNFDAAGGAWISPDGDIVLLSTEHATNGHDWSVKAMEFLPDVPVAKTTCSDKESSWVEFFDDKGFKDRSLHVTLDAPSSQHPEPLDDLDQAENFEDKISSLRFCGAPGVRVRFYEHKNPCSGQMFELEGNGSVQEYPDLHALGFGDEFSCVVF